jgi:hypothetical protein
MKAERAIYRFALIVSLIGKTKFLENIKYDDE